MDGTGDGEASPQWRSSLYGLNPCNWLLLAVRTCLRCLGLDSPAGDPTKREVTEGAETNSSVVTDEERTVLPSVMLRARAPGRREVAPGNGGKTNRSAA